MSELANRRDKDRKRRRRLRLRLESEGVASELIEQIIDRQRWEDLVARLGREKAIEATPDFMPDDTGYKPPAGDPLLRGAGRVDGVTARVMRRHTTITHYQYEREVSDE